MRSSSFVPGIVLGFLFIYPLYFCNSNLSPPIIIKPLLQVVLKAAGPLDLLERKVDEYIATTLA